MIVISGCMRSYRYSCKNQCPTHERWNADWLSQKHPSEARNDQERQTHEGVGEMQRGMAQDPDPNQGRDSIESKGGDQPAIEHPVLPGSSGGNGQGGLFEKHLPQGYAEDAGDGDNYQM